MNTQADLFVNPTVELPVQPSSPAHPGRNYENPPWCYLLWGIPAMIIIGADFAYQDSLLSATAAGALWVFSIAWIGAGCYINGQSCGRVHCKIDGIAFPVLTIIGILNMLGIVSFNWSLYLLVFLIILVASFVPELTWKKYS